jgi:membrane protein implicated in regulation of membrane protease activity
MVLPWAGVGLGLAGGWQLSHAEPGGWRLLGAGVALLIADVIIDFVWAHPAVSRSDQPQLNRRAAQLIGRVLVVAEAIEGGRGKVRVGDTLWPVEGPDAPAGAEVRVTSAGATLLQVERLR